jgi:hypothetical protein
MRIRDNVAIDMNEIVLYSDMDGVITDFDSRFMEYSRGITPKRYEYNLGINQFWNLINKAGVEFWSEMSWMKDGKEYWKYIKKYKPIILSAPSQHNSSHIGKKLWIKNNLPNIKLILKPANEKQELSGPNNILIDDKLSNIEQWVNRGGIGILHTSAISTIEKLKILGL